MTLVSGRFFGYVLSYKQLEDWAAARGYPPGPQLPSDPTPVIHAKWLAYAAGLGKSQAALHLYPPRNETFCCIALASSYSLDSWRDKLPMNPPPPEEYAALRRLLGTDKVAQWYVIQESDRGRYD